MRTVDTIARTYGHLPQRLPAPNYNGKSGERRLALAVESMSRHMTDEGWQLMLALRCGGYSLSGYNCDINGTDVKHLIDRHEPNIVFLQDKREWLGLTADRSRDPRIKFENVEALQERPDIFKVTVLKDAQSDPDLHAEAATQAGVHAWVVYYHPTIVSALNPFVRPEHLIRTYHTIDPDIVPPYSPERRRMCVVSGALNRKVYPLRCEIVRRAASRLGWSVIRHPGYHAQGSNTPNYVRELSRHRVAVCTSSVYGYALRKIIEATAAGCRVVTDLPVYDVLPEIDGNLIRVPGDTDFALRSMIEAENAAHTYDPDQQYKYRMAAIRYYSYQVAGQRLAADIERMRTSYVSDRTVPGVSP